MNLPRCVLASGTGTGEEPRVPSLSPTPSLPGLTHIPLFLPPLSKARFHLFQGIIWPQVLSGVVGNCINCLANYVLVSLLSLGVR